MTGNTSNAGSKNNQSFVIVLTNGSKYEAKLRNHKARDKPYEIELSAQHDFQPSLICSKQYIKEVYLEARGNDGWYIASIETYARESERYINLTADPDFNKWVDGDNEDQYPYNAKKHLLTKNELITYVKVEAMTGNTSDAGSSSHHRLVIVLKNGSKYEAELRNYKARDGPYEKELTTQSDFQPSLVCSKQNIKEVYLEAQGKDRWYIASIETYTREDEWYTKLTADPDFNKWVDGDQEEYYPYDAKKHLLTKNAPPKLDPELRNLSVPLNSKFSKKCIVRGDRPLQINWTKNGVDLGNQNNNTYSVDHMTFNDTGLYGCTATNWAGQVQTTFWIDVTVSPQIYVSPRNKSVPEGHPVNFSCKATGVPKPTMSWKFNDGDLPSGVNQTRLGEESFLELSKTTKQMEGIYKCTAQNKANTTASSAYLHVFEKPSAEVSPKPYPKLLEGDELRLTCTVSKATVAIKWKKTDDEGIPRAQIDTQLDNKLSKLYIANVVESDSGEYSCEARNSPGIVARSTVKINVKSVTGSVSWLVQQWYYIVGPVLGCIVIFAVGWYISKRRRAAFVISHRDFTCTAMPKLPHQEQAIKMEVPNVEVDEWEIAVDRVVLQEVIGRGAFGAVWRAVLKEPDGKPGNRTVAVKCFTPTSGEDGRKSLMREIELGKLLGENPQTNIVEFIGCVTTQALPILVMEYLACGDLLGYLRKSRGIHDKYHLGQGSVPELEIYDLVLFAKQIAAGMVFLGSRGIIHRDLAARNVLLDDNFVCKVTDFGLAYQNFKYGHGNAKKGCMPIKWTAPEILSGEFSALSTQSDVWSYGIVLYEIFTIGGIPYPGWSEGRVVQAVLDGYQMPKPDHIEDQLYDVMTRCWNLNPDFRPPFENLRKRMDTYLREETYTELLNMGKYESMKYSKVEDLGAQGEPPSEQVKTSTTGKKLGKWTSVL